MYSYILTVMIAFWVGKLIYDCTKKQEYIPPVEDSKRLAAMHKARMRDIWISLGYAGRNGTPFRIVLFGAGKFTLWLEKSVADLPGPTVVAVLDDNPNAEFRFMGLPAVKSEQFNMENIDMIMLCTDTYGAAMKKRCTEIFKNVRIYDPYSEVPPGPYPKE